MLLTKFLVYDILIPVFKNGTEMPARFSLITGPLYTNAYLVVELYLAAGQDFFIAVFYKNFRRKSYADQVKKRFMLN